MNRDNSVIWYVISLGVSMSYLPVKGIQYMINQARIVAVDFTISIMSLIFAVVFAVVVAVLEGV